MKIDPKLVVQWWDEAMANSPSGIGAMSFFAQRAADHALEEAEKTARMYANLCSHPIEIAEAICDMKGTK